jgi:hypothetical protein
MRRSFPFLVLLLATAAACSKSNPGSAPSQSGPATSYDTSGNAAESAAPSRAAGGPNVGVTAAPGVAFDYRYEFRLPPTQISAVEEQHAQMCERLTVARCRITGMYFRVNSAHNVEGNLAFRLDPAIARTFGRDGVATVVGAGGMLSESEISGTDVNPTIHQANRSLAELQADLQRIEGQLRATNLDPDEKARLEDQAQQLREQIRAAGSQREEAQASLATTPMVFRYTSGEPTLGQSLQDSADSFLDSAVVLLRVLIALLPWAVAAGLIWAIVRYVRKRWFAPKAPAEVAAD